jgi:hypothetical protein
MTNFKFTGKLGELIERAEQGNESDIDYIMTHLTNESSLAMTRYVDYALSLVEKRRKRDSNPRYLAVQQFSRLPHSTALPFLRGKSSYIFLFTNFSEKNNADYFIF